VAGAQCGLSYSYLGLLERGQRFPSTLVAEGIADGLHLNAAQRVVLIAHSGDDVGRCWQPPGAAAG
jgi:hypothetical protein